MRKAIRDGQVALADLVHAIREYRKLGESKPVTLEGADYAEAAQELNRAIARADSHLTRGTAKNAAFGIHNKDRTRTDIKTYCMNVYETKRYHEH